MSVHNILPTKENLCHRRVLDESTCKACGLASKTTAHLFWKCTKAVELWDISGISFDTHGVRFHDFVNWLWYLIYKKHVGNDLLELIVTITWCMWFNRNKVRMVQPRQMGSQILHKARGMLSKFQLAHHRPLQHKDAMDSRWVPPSPPWYKINVDAAIFNQLNSVGVGALIRDHEGSVLAAMSKHLPLSLGSLEA